MSKYLQGKVLRKLMQFTSGSWPHVFLLNICNPICRNALNKPKTTKKAGLFSLGKRLKIAVLVLTFEIDESTGEEEEEDQ